MKSFNESIKRLLAFVPQFESFKEKVELHMASSSKTMIETANKINVNSTSLKNLTAKNSSIEESLSKCLNEVRGNSGALNTLKSRVLTLDSALYTVINDDNDKKRILELNEQIETIKSELSIRGKKISDLETRLSLTAESVSDNYTELSGSVERVQGLISDSAMDKERFESSRRTFGDQIGILKSYIDKEFKDVRRENDDAGNKKSIDTLKNDLKALSKSVEKASKDNKKDVATNDEIKNLKAENKKLKKLVLGFGDELNNFKKAFEE